MSLGKTALEQMIQSARTSWNDMAKLLRELAFSRATGVISGNGSTQLINLGFTPEYVCVFNATDADIKHEWFLGLSNDVAMKQALLSYQKITSEGITPINTTSIKGFQIGTTISESAKQLTFVAIGRRF